MELHYITLNTSRKNERVYGEMRYLPRFYRCIKNRRNQRKSYHEWRVFIGSLHRRKPSDKEKQINRVMFVSKVVSHKISCPTWKHCSILCMVKHSCERLQCQNKKMTMRYFWLRRLCISSQCSKWFLWTKIHWILFVFLCSSRMFFWSSIAYTCLISSPLSTRTFQRGLR